MADKINRLRAGFLVAACLLAVFGFQVLPSTSNVALAATSIGTGGGIGTRLHPTGFFDGWFVSANVGWFVFPRGTGAVLARTEDAGNHWQPQLTLQYPHLFQRDMSFLDSSTGFVVVGTFARDSVVPRLYATTDRGQHWAPRSLPSTSPIGGVDFVNAQTGWLLQRAAGAGSILYFSRDGGNSWKPCRSPSGVAMAGVSSADHLEGVRFVDSSRGWIGAWKPSGEMLYYATVDGCASWTTVPLRLENPASSAHSVLFVDPPELVQSGVRGITLDSAGSQGGVRSTVFTAASRSQSSPLREAGQTGADLRKTLAMNNDATRNVLGLQTVGDKVAFAEARGGDHQDLLRTVDGGRTWAVSTSISSAMAAAQPDGALCSPVGPAVADRSLSTSVGSGCNYPPCWDTECNNGDPQTSGCSSQGTYVVDALAATTNYTYDDQLRYSSWCGANWGRTDAELCDSTGCPSAIWFESTYPYGYNNPTIFKRAWNDGYQVWNYTPMYSGYSSHDRVCRPNSSTLCTNWY
jgi:photosystem II stability/assembly factor-like uncharacterized protein